MIDENSYLCGSCAPASASSSASVPVPVPAPALSAKPSSTAGLPMIRKSTTKTHIPRKSVTSTDAIRHTESKVQSSNTTAVAMSVAGGLLVLGLLVLMLSGNDTKKTTADTTKSAIPTAAPAPVVVPVSPAPQEVRPTPVASVPAAPILPAAPVPSTEALVPPKPERNEMEDMRNDLAAAKLRDAKAFASANPSDPFTYKEKLEALANSYRSTPAGQEAVKILYSLKVPDRPVVAATPPPTGSGEWKTIISPQVMDGLSPYARNTWVVNGDALTKTSGKDDAAQSRVDFGDGEFRFRFSVNNCSHMFISMHQGDGCNQIVFERPQLSTMQGKTQELLVTCVGTKVTASLFGAPVPVNAINPTPTGRIQFNYKEGEFHLYSIDYRKLDK